MKLLMKSNCVVAGGKIALRGNIHDTGDIDAAADKEAYSLLASDRAFTADDKSPEAEEFRKEIAAEKEAAKAKAAKEVKDPKEVETDPKKNK